MVIASRLRWLTAALLVPFAAELAAHGDHGKPDKERPLDGLGASAVFDASGTLWAVSKGGDHVVLHRSADLGQTWSWGMAVNLTPEPIGAESDARPKIAVGPKGELYVSWTQPLAKPYTGYIRLARSLDRGKSFSAPVTVHADRQEITHRFDAVTVNREGRVFIAWVDKRDAEAARGKRETYRGAATYYAVSDDRGASFRGDFKLADHSCECCRIAMLPRGDGSVTAFWRHVFAPNLRDHAIASLHADGRVEGFRRATFDNWATDACPHHGPSLAEDAAGQLHAVWFTLGRKQQGAHYGRLRDGAVDGLRRIGDKTAAHPDLAIAGNRIALAWKEFDGEASRLRGMLSDDGGATWREIAIAATQGASDQPRLLTHQGRFYAFWNTRATPRSVHALP